MLKYIGICGVSAADIGCNGQMDCPWLWAMSRAMHLNGRNCRYCFSAGLSFSAKEPAWLTAAESARFVSAVQKRQAFSDVLSYAVHLQVVSD